MSDEPINEHDHDELPDGEAYLWDRSSPADPEVQRLERTLGSLRYRGHAPQLPVRTARRISLPLAAAAVLTVAGASTWLVLRSVQSSPPSWVVQTIAGTGTVDSRPLGAAGRLGVGQWLETGSTARLRLEVSDIGTVTVFPNTRLGLLETKPRKVHRLQLDRGRIEALITAPPRLFFVNTPSAVAIDLGCAYELEVDDDGRGLLQVTFGLVSLEHDGRTSIVPMDGMCQTRPMVGPGTPYFCNASESLKRALERFDFEDGCAAALDVVLMEAGVRDTLTLWHLLSRASHAQIGKVFDRLAVLASPPPSVTRDGILRLDTAMLQQWWDDLEPTWLD